MIGVLELTQGSNCGETSVCVGGAICQDKCTCIDGISQANGSTCEPLTGKVNGQCTDGTSCDDSHAICNTTTNLCKCEEGFAPEPTTQTCGLAKGEGCKDNPLSCLKGSECDPTVNMCRLELGQICDKDMDCVSGTVCDTDATCKIAFGGTCSTSGSDCASGTFCDSLNKCKYGKAHVCKNREECSAGAKCQSSYCSCAREFSNIQGVLCAPKSGRIGSDCGGLAMCDASLGGICGSTQKCECPPGKAVAHDLSCQGYNTQGDPKLDDNKNTKNRDIPQRTVFGSVFRQ
ncbi:multiple epidermal growth factor-like domains protein 6 [Littorina saxatilis]|uniref:multiple epidermal growth factor-like domains protein 6 n=1 Tax=Littorina saxatilis TaxID=31220 RepID=UPI0038B4C862